MHVCHNTIVYQSYQPQLGDTHHKVVVLRYGSGSFCKLFNDYKFSGVLNQTVIRTFRPFSRFQGSFSAGKVYIIQNTETATMKRGLLCDNTRALMLITRVIYVAWTNVTLTVGICYRLAQEPTFKIWASNS